MNTTDTTFNRTEATPIDWAKAACDSLVSSVVPGELPPANRWHYHQGVFLQGMLALWEQTKDAKYLLYPKAYVDHLIDEQGNFYFSRDELDAIQPGLLLFTLDKHFKEPRYRIAMEKLRQLFRTLNRTAEGGFWHKDKYPYQMWLDGLYMGGVFAIKYEVEYGEAGLIEQTLHQEKLMRTYMSDPATGLLYHAWDEKRQTPWANPETGCSPEFWGRSLGWYGLALADFLDALPADHEAREQLTTSLGNFAAALARYQDEASGLWYQVVDKGDRPENWLETSGSALFVYAIVKAIKHGYADADGSLTKAAKHGYQGLVNRMKFDEQGRFVMPDICIGTSAGDYTNYMTRPVCENDLHGVGAFVLTCVEMDGIL
ncbi:glycoside hydrolase family 105 protein [Paenibacillus sp. FSL H7-0331]|uniref:glycoside hydrolase family 88/105 protein n=1 Tax=Paenibacillus sp. FSL H7-0331 TaxID=1920421 RepID=UPI00096C2216|nr:glycoside hydrolase family 88 protein [Paenibacillus sp. FSL H7-0331]OMF20849.1 glycoside hydrolase 105 family protein [Paenibacillus sp. FSL H7-0331]